MVTAVAEVLQRAVADDWRTKWRDNSSLMAYLFWDDSVEELHQRFQLLLEKSKRGQPEAQQKQVLYQTKGMKYTGLILSVSSSSS